MKCHCYKLHIHVSFAKTVMAPIPAELPLSECHVFDHLMIMMMKKEEEEVEEEKKNKKSHKHGSCSVMT